jgi:hypothetical protein
MESVLVCIDCLTGLCMKCLKQRSNPHKDHQLEELSDAKILLREKLVSQTRKQLRTEMTSATPVNEITRAERDIRVMSSELKSVITKWRNTQLYITGKLKDEAAKRAQVMKAQNTELEAMMEEDIDISTLIRRLNSKDNVRVKPVRESTYNFETARRTLSNQLTSRTTSSKNVVKGKFLQLQTKATTSTITSTITSRSRLRSRSRSTSRSMSPGQNLGRKLARHNQESTSQVRRGCQV